MKVKSIAVIGVIIVIGVLVLVLQANGNLPFLDQFLGNINPFKPKETQFSVDIVITDVKQVSQLVTTKYTIQQVEQKGAKSGLAWWHLIMVEKGTVEAGLDLTQFTQSNVIISEENKSITVNLPPVVILTERDRILSSKPEDTYRYEFDSRWWWDLPNADNVETQMRGEASDRILESVCNDGILKTATEDAKTAIERFLKTTASGYIITVVSAPVPSECKAK